MMPKISVLIPTRERAETLGPCIQTCLAQDYDNMEVLVSDNASSPATHATVASFSDSRLQYFRQDTRVSMRQNFEFLINQAKGDYIIIIGDDDGLMPGAIRRIAQFLKQNPVDVLNWTGIVYYWPNLASSGLGYLMVKYGKVFGGLQSIDPKRLLNDFATGKVNNYVHGAAIYHGCISSRLIPYLKQPNGQFFNNHMPDVYCCVALLYAAKTMARLNHPLSISGVSRASTGSSFLADANSVTKTGTLTPYQIFADESAADPGVSFHYNTNVRAAQYHCAQSLIVANELFGSPMTVDQDAWARIILDEVSKNPELLEVTRTMDSHSDLDRKIKALIAGAKTRSLFPTAAKPLHYNEQHRRLKRFDVPTARGGKDTVFTAYQTAADLFRGEYDSIADVRSSFTTRVARWSRFLARARKVPQIRASI